MSAFIEFIGSVAAALCFIVFAIINPDYLVSGWWIFFLLSLCILYAVRLILGTESATNQFIILFPITSITLWLFASSIDLDIAPILVIIISVMFFCFPLKLATVGVALFILNTSVVLVNGQFDLSILLWMPVYGVIWGGMFWMMLQERERFRTKISSIEHRARGLLTGSSPALDNADLLPDLDRDTQMVKAVASVFRIDRLVEQILDLINESLHPFSCFFFFLDHDAGYMKVLAHKSKSRFFNPEATIEVVEEGLFSWVFKSKRHLAHEKLPRSKQYPSYYSSRERILSCMIFPVITNDRVEGILGVDSRRSNSFGGDEERVMRVFSEIIGDIVEAFRLYQERESHAVYMEAFYKAIKLLLESKLDLNKRLELLVEISQMIKNSDEIAVAVLAENDRLIVRAAAGIFFQKLIGASIHPDSVVGKSVKSGTVISNLNLDTLSIDNHGIVSPAEPSLKVNSLLIVQLLMEDNHIGILILGSRRREYFTHDDEFVFGTLAAQFGFSVENALNAEKIERLAVTDGLTQLFNHRYFQDCMIREIKRSKREPITFSLLMVDIDHFKKFNDTFGHQAGDQILKSIAKLLKEQAREVDVAARYGGEEFAVILIGSKLDMATKTAERIRRLCEKQQFKIGDQLVSVTMSIGVANYPTQALTPTELIEAADKALYEAKSSGRNRIMVSSVVLD